MTEVLELEKIETEQKRELPKPEKDTWILKLPAELYRQEGVAEGTMVGLTIKNGGILTAFIRPPSEKLQAISQRLLKKIKTL